MLRKILTLTTLILALSSPAMAEQGGFSQLNGDLNQKLEALLQQETLRPVRMGVDVSWEPIKKGACERCGSYRLKLPAHLERDTFINVELSFRDKQPVLKGQVLHDSEKQTLIAAITQSLGKPLETNIDVFPFDNVGLDYALVKTASADLYVKPEAVAGENLATQARLGTALQILTYSSNSKMAKVRVQDDGYIAWIKRSDLQEGQESWYQDWLKHNQVLILAAQSKPVMIPYGTRLKLIEAQKNTVLAMLPNNAKISLSKSDLVLSEAGQLPSAVKLIETAQLYLPKAIQGGGHYLWGGTLGKSLDCSGFVQTIYRVNGVYLPRDADQQKGFTQSVANNLAQVNELQPGDLVFFSSHGKWPTHVGMYIGDGKFIHSSSKGQYNGVKINSFRGTTSYDKFLQSIYFGGGRVVRSL